MLRRPPQGIIALQEGVFFLFGYTGGSVMRGFVRHCPGVYIREPRARLAL